MTATTGAPRTRTVPGGRPRRGGLNRRRQTRTAYLLLAPALLFFAILFFYPLGSEFVASFLTGPRAQDFAGVRNYREVLSDPATRHAFAVTVEYAVGSLAASVVLGLVLAVILNERLRGRTVLRGLLLVPYLTSISIVGLLWRNILDPQVGILNRLLDAAGLPQQQWLATHPLGVLVGITAWQQTGYVMVLFLAGLQGIPELYYEAAKVDGATPWRRFRSITLPLPTTMFVTIIGVISTLQQFALPYIITDGGPGDATDLYVFHVYQTTFQSSDFGYAAALSFALLVVVLLISLAQLRLSRRGADR